MKRVEFQNRRTDYRIKSGKVLYISMNDRDGGVQEREEESTSRGKEGHTKKVEGEEKWEERIP
jgi:hypothetical protein